MLADPRLCASCMLKRNGIVATRDDELSLFDFGNSNGRRNFPDPIRTNGSTPLAGSFGRQWFREMEATGMLMEPLFVAQETTIEEMEAHPAARNGTEDDAVAGMTRRGR